MTRFEKACKEMNAFEVKARVAREQGKIAHADMYAKYAEGWATNARRALPSAMRNAGFVLSR